jgi:hypothetical protein
MHQQPTTNDQREHDPEQGGDGAGRRRLEVDRLVAVSRNLGRQLEAQVRERPLVALGAAAGVGFVAGSLLGSRLGQIAIALGIGYLAKNLVNGEPGGVERLVERGIEKLERAAG